MYRSITPLFAFLATVYAKTIPIDVGMDGALQFQPNQVLAQVGDTLEFHFYSGSGGHSVVSGSFDAPCVPGASSFFSGYIPGDGVGDMTFVTTVNSTDPIYFYCSLGHHCQAGMVGVVNPAQGQTLAAYMSAAQSVAKASAPAALQGGVLTSENANAPATSGSSSMASSMSGTMTAAGGSSMSMTGSSGAGATGTVMSTAASGTGSGSASGSASGSGSSAASGTGTAATATPTKSVGARKDELSVVLGLAVILGALVALMA